MKEIIILPDVYTMPNQIEVDQKKVLLKASLF